jgi:CDP-diacylglycerol--serine O-phosphatidyltransferase
MIFISKFSKPSLITYLGIAVSITGIYFATTDLRLSIVCLFACAVCDFFDGKFARSFKRNEYDKKFGIIIDSLTDVLMFVTLPCVILFCSTSFVAVAILVAIIYALCGITRLAVFTVETDPNKKTEFYRGLPTTCVGVIIPAVYFTTTLTTVFIAEIILLATYLALAVLFVLNIKVKKP